MSVGEPFEEVLLGQYGGAKIFCFERRNSAPTVTEAAKMTPASPAQSSCSTEYTPSPLGTSTVRLDRSSDEREEDDLKRLIHHLEQSNGIIHASGEQPVWLPENSAFTEQCKEDYLVTPTPVKSMCEEAGTHEAVEEQISEMNTDENQRLAGMTLSQHRGVGQLEACAKAAHVKKAPPMIDVPEVLEENVESRWLVALPMLEVPEDLELNVPLENGWLVAPPIIEVPEVLENVEENRRPVAIKLPRLDIMQSSASPPGAMVGQVVKSERPRIVRRPTL